MNNNHQARMDESIARQTPMVSAIVVTYWTGPPLRESLPSILAEPEVGELVVVDNGNDRDTAEWLLRLAAEDVRVKLCNPGSNIGFSAGCNFGASCCHGDFVALINPDLVVTPGTLNVVLASLRKHPDAWVAGIRLVNTDGTVQRGTRREILTPWRAFAEIARLDRLFPNHPHFRRFHSYKTKIPSGVQAVSTVSGAFMMLPRVAYQRLGGLDDNIFIHVEDSDLCLRVQQLGAKVIYCDDVRCRHYLSTSDVSRVFVEWHKIRSTCYYFHKHFHSTYPHWALTLISVALWGRFWLRAIPLAISDVPVLVRHWRRRPRSRVTGSSVNPS